jgi:metal-responsive CopG/Arc/MetJ family transcriptional regulator
MGAYNMGRTNRITISLSPELVRFADRLAAEKKMSRSKVLSSCLQEAAEKQHIADMAEGYRAMAKQNKEMADIASAIGDEVIPERKRHDR